MTVFFCATLYLLNKADATIKAKLYGIFTNVYDKFLSQNHALENLVQLDLLLSVVAI